MQISHPKTALSKKLSLLYSLALSAVAFFSIVGQILIQITISQQQDDARVVNIAGRQRMLSQKLSKTSILIVHPEYYLADAEYYYEDIKKILEIWQNCHYGLKNAQLKIENKFITVENSATIDSMFAEIQPFFTEMYNNASIIQAEIESPTSEKTQNLANALTLLLKNERNYLTLMDKIVFQYDIEAKERIEELKKIELGLFVFTILILLLEGLFIFRPTYKHINTTIDELKDSESNLQKLNFELQETNRDLTQAKNELLKATEEKYKLILKEDKIRSASLIQGQEDERKRMALELHDGIGQMLTGLKLMAEKLNKNTFEQEKDRKTFDSLKNLLEDTIAETRVISYNLMPSVLNDFGIISGLKLLCEQTEKNSSIKTKLTYNYPSNTRLSQDLEITLYRLAQEGINNVVKHAKATELSLILNVDNEAIILLIIDNGVGFDMRKLKSRVIKNGIKNMKSRAELHDGELKIHTKIGEGTRIWLRIPMNNNKLI